MATGWDGKMDFEREWNVDAAADRQQAPEPELAALAARVKGHPIQPGTMRTVTPGPDGTVVLPAGTDINHIEVDGRNLVVTLPDGTQMVILDGAVVVPRIVVGDVEIPSVNLAALLIGEEPQPAAGPARSSGGNFLAADGEVGDPHGLGDLLPPTELSFNQTEEREILPIAPLEDDGPDGEIITPNQPAGATNATATVSEAGLAARGAEPAGSAAAGDSERTSGTIVFSANDGPSVVTIGGVAVTSVGQTFTTSLGVLTITSIEDGSIGYSYTLSDNVVGGPPTDVFTVVVTDADGDQATATLSISITDDGPQAVNDADSVTEDGPLVADGNVLTGTGGSDANSSDGVADVQGADGVTSITTGTFQGAYGTLVLSAGGGYRYELANGNPAVQFLTPGQTLTDSFSYTITDADGSASSATLTITINGADDGVTITGLTDGPGANGAELVVLENDLADGSSPDAAALTQSGSFSVSGPDGLTSVTVGGVTVLANGAFVAGQVVTTPLGTLTITGFTATSQQGGVPTAGSFSYTFLLTDNSLGHGAAGADNVFQSFDVVATDRNGSTAAGSIDVQIVDDLPTARADVDGVAAGSYGPEGGNVISGAGTVSSAAGADTRGADDAAVAGVAPGVSEAALVSTSTVGQGIHGLYGTLTLNGDGSYSYVRDAGTPGGVSDSFTYTLRDGDGDLSVATLRIDIADSDVMIISIPRMGEGTVVDEAGLDAGVGAAPGSNAGADVETTAGVITYTAPDAPSTVTINGIPVVQAGQQIQTDKGYLEIISVSEGRIEYSYTLTTNTNNSGSEPVTDSFEVTVTDVDGDSATDTLVITILDDHPTAFADVDFVKEDGSLVADGNVLTGSGGDDANATDGVADVQGADGASVTGISFGGVAGVVGQEVKGAYGTLTILEDGRYFYTLDNQSGVVQGLDSTETLTETFTYSITDGDNDAARATLTITIEGSDDGVTIEGLSGKGAELTVLEDDLLNGSSPNAGELTQSNSFTLTAPDGVATVTVGGQTIFANGSFIAGVVISNAYGTLKIDSFMPTTGADGDVVGGTINYSYVLNDNTLLHAGANDVSLTDSFLVEVLDTDGSQASASLDVAVFDDAPEARDDVAVQQAENAAVLINVVTGEGTLTGAAGADTLGADEVNLAVGGQLVLTSGPSQGSAVYQGNGVFLYTPAAGAIGEDSFTYTITDGDGDSSTATVTITLAGDSTPVVLVGDLTVSEAGLPNGTQSGGNSETAGGAMTITTGGDTLTKVEVQDKNGVWQDVTGATVGTPVVVQGAAGALTVTSDGLGHYSYSYTLAVNNPAHPDNNAFDGDGISGAADTLPGDSFAVRVTDSDGDVSPSASIDVTVQDDAPIAAVDGDTTVIEGATATGTWSQTIGADQPGASTVVVVGANSYAIGTPINTGLGTLTVNSNGTWALVSNNNLNNASDPSLSFTVKVTDADNDVAQDTQTISITDGAGPTAGAPLSLQMDDQNLANGSTPAGDDFASGKISFTAGSDALTGFAFSQNLNSLGGGLTWNRVSATLIEGWDGGINTGTKIITLTLTAPASIGAGSSGDVTVTATLIDNYDSHPVINQDDLVALGSVGVTASDQDGSSATATVNLSVSDDIPTAGNDVQLAVLDDNATAVLIGTVAGLTGNDSYGADGQGSPAIVIGTGSLGGTISIVNGNLLYSSHHNVAAPYAPVTETFTYTIKDGDGDTASATFSVQLTDTGPSINAAAASFTVDEDGLANGISLSQPGDAPGADVVKTGTLAGFSFGQDGPGDIVLASANDTGLRTLSGNVVRTVWDPSTHVLTGEDAVTGVDVFTLKITDVETGAYRFELLAPIQHSDPASEDDKSLTIAVQITDAENETANGSISITIDDDRPIVADDNIGTSESASASTGNVLSNDLIGADQPGSVASVNNVAIAVGGSQIINGSFGTLTIYSNGQYSYTPKASVPAGSFDSFTYVMKDADGDTGNAVLKFTFGGDPNLPTAGTTAATVDDDGLTGGNPLSILGDVNANAGDADPAANEASFSGTLPFAFGPDGAGSVTFANLNGQTGVVGADTVLYSWNGTTNTLTATIVGGRGTDLFKVAVNPGTGAYTVTLLDNVLHSTGGNENNASVTLNYQVTDSDYNASTNAGSRAIGQLGISFNDDMPSAFTPAAGSVQNNDSPATLFNLNFANVAGADGVGNVLFNITDGAPAKDTGGATLRLNGEDLFIYGNGTNVLTAKTADGDIGYTITLQPGTDKYLFDLHGTITNGSEISISSFSAAKAGNTDYRGLGVDTTDAIDVLFSGRGSSGARGSVNTDSDSIGINNQSVNPDEAVRIDLVKTLTGSGGGTTGFAYADHQSVISFEQKIAQVGGNPNNMVSIKVTAIDADNDQDLGFSSTTNEAGESFVGIIKVVVTDVSTNSVYTFTPGGLSTQGAIGVTFSSTSVTITGLQVNDTYEIVGAKGFDAVLVESPHSNNDFDLGVFSVETLNSGAPININHAIVASDADNDSVNASVSVTLTPVAPPAPPVAIDLDGDGLEFVGLSAGVQHDYGSGLVNTAWMASDDGLLAHAVGGSYDIVFADDAQGAASDLEGLRLAYDSNGDGVFDAKDAAFAEFGVWQDANGNGQVDAGEFKSLTDAGVAAIELTSNGVSYQAAGGDVTVLGEASFVRTDGSKGTIGDVMFATAKATDASKTAESSSSGFNQALVAASLVAVAGAAAVVEQEKAPVIDAKDAPLTETAPASTTSAESEATSQDGAPMSVTVEPSHTVEQPVEQGHHGGDEAATDHVTLADADDGPAPMMDSADAAQPDLGDHQGLLAQSIDLPAFDGNAALLAVSHEAAPTALAEVVSEALGAADAPHIDTLLAALPGGDHAPVMLDPVAAEPIDSGHMAAAAAAIFEAAIAAHEAMAVAHG
jgi:large repetitive protein